MVCKTYEMQRRKKNFILLYCAHNCKKIELSQLTLDLLQISAASQNIPSDRIPLTKCFAIQRLYQFFNQREGNITQKLSSSTDDDSLSILVESFKEGSSL